MYTNHFTLFTLTSWLIRFINISAMKYISDIFISKEHKGFILL